MIVINAHVFIQKWYLTALLTIIKYSTRLILLHERYNHILSWFIATYDNYNKIVSGRLHAIFVICGKCLR